MTLWGWLPFTQIPDALVLTGAAIVVASGLALLWFEVRRETFRAPFVARWRLPFREEAP